MQSSEVGREQLSQAAKRIEERLIGYTAALVLSQAQCPSSAHFLVRDTETGVLIGGVLQKVIGASGERYSIIPIGTIKNGFILEMTMGNLKRKRPEMALLCDESTRTELEARFGKQEGDHFWLDLPEGALDVYAPTEPMTLK